VLISLPSPARASSADAAVVVGERVIGAVSVRRVASGEDHVKEKVGGDERGKGGFDCLEAEVEDEEKGWEDVAFAFDVKDGVKRGRFKG
jgi:hypothetical protein